MMFFLKKIFFFSIPVAVAAVIPVLILFFSGEFVSSEKIMARQFASPYVLVGKAYMPVGSDLLFQRIEMQKPQVLALGNSRVLQIRREFFVEGTNFYNAGGSILNTYELNQFLSHLSYTPKIIFLGLEQSYFHTMWNNTTMMQPQPEQAKATFHESMSIAKKVYTDLLQRKFSLQDLFDKNTEYETIGLNARVHHNGLRSDGSYLYGQILSNPQDATLEDFQFKDILGRIHKGERRFEYGTEVSADAVQNLEKFLEECYKRHITVVAFLPPYAPTVWHTMQTLNQGMNYKYISLLYPTLQPLFKKYGFELLDFSHVETFAQDKNFIDGFHGSERVYAHMLLRFSSSSVDSVLNRSLLETNIQKSSLDLAIFPN